MNGLIAWFAQNSVAANLLFVLVVLGGLFTLGDLRQEVSDFVTWGEVATSLLAA